MTNILTNAALAVALACLGGCASGPSSLGSGEVTKAILGNLQGCTRTYIGAAGSLTPTISVHIECRPAAVAPPPPSAAAPADPVF